MVGKLDPYAVMNFSRAGRSAAAATDPAIAYAEREAAYQRILRGFDSSAQIGAAYAASRVHESQDYAKTELDRILAAQARGVPIPQERIDELQRLVNPSFKDQLLQKAAPVFKVLELFDRPRQFLTLAAKDIFQADQKHGQEIGLDDYVNLIKGDKQALIRDLGEGVVGDDGFVGFSTVLDDIGWKKGDNAWLNAVRGVATFGGEVLTDPLTFVSGGALGLAKAQRGAVLKSAVYQKGVDAYDIANAIRKGAPLDESTELARRLFQEGTDIADTKVAVVLDEVRAAVEGRVDTDGILSRYGIDVEELRFIDEVAPGRVDVDEIVSQLDKSRIVHDEVADVAAMEAGDVIFNQAAPAAMAKDWLDPTLQMVADSTNETMLKGGLRLHVPIYTQRSAVRRGQARGVTGRTPKVTRGLGRKISNALLGQGSEYARAASRGPKGATGVRRFFEESLAPNVYQRWTEAAEKFSDNGFWRRVMRGQDPNPGAALRAKDAMTLDLADVLEQSGWNNMGRRLANLNAAAETHELAEADVTALKAALGSVLETNPRATTQELSEHLQRAVAATGQTTTKMPRDVVDAAVAYLEQQRRYFDYMQKQMKELGIAEGDGIENYLPHMLTGEMNEYLDILVNRGVAPSTGDDIADQMLRALIEARVRAKTVGETVAGEAAAASQRTLGRTAIRGTGNQSFPYVIGDSVLIDRNFAPDMLTVQELNERLRKAMDNIAEETGVRPPKQGKKGDPFNAYNPDPITTLQAYGHDVMMAVVERKLIRNLEEMGLVEDGVRYLNQQALAESLARRLGDKFGGDVFEFVQARQAQIQDQRMQRLAAISDDPDKFLADVPTTKVSLGGVEVDIPTAAIEGNRQLARDIDKITNKQVRGEELQRRAAAFHKDAFDALVKKGVPPERANQLAHSETKRELREVVGATREETKVATRATLDHFNAILVTQRELRDQVEAAYQQTLAEAAAIREEGDRLLREVTQSIQEVRRTEREVSDRAAIGTVEAMTDEVRAMHNAMVKDIQALADHLTELGEVDAGMRVSVMADYLLNEGATSDLTSLGGDIREIVESVTQKHRAQVDQYFGDPRIVAEADQYMDQAVWYDGDIMDTSWGPDLYKDARYVFHGTSRPNAAQIAQSRHWGSGGMTANPVRATQYSSEGWVVIWDLEDMPQAIRDSVRSGNDIEDRAQWLLLTGVGEAEGVGVPRPVAVLPAQAVREAAARRVAGDIDHTRMLGRTLASKLVNDYFGATVPNAFRGKAARRFYNVIDQAMDDPTFASSQEFRDAVFEQMEGSKLGRRSGLGSSVDGFVDEFRQQLTNHRDYIRKGAVGDFDGKPFDIRHSKERKAAISAWHDEWAGKATEKGTPVRTVGEPVSAPWVEATAADHANSYRRVWAELQGTSTKELQAEDALGRLNFEDLNTRVDEFFELAFIRYQSGQVTGEMQDLINAAQRSLRARGLGEEFPVWVIDMEHGMTRASLVPVEGATAYLVHRDDVLMDWGSLYPQQLDLLDDAARARRHHVMLDGTKLQVVEDVALESATGMPPKVALHNMKPENITYQRMLAIFGDADVADQAYNDLLSRFNLLGPVDEQRLEMLARMRAAASDWYGVGPTPLSAGRAGLLGHAEQVLRNPDEFGEFFANPHVQHWWAKLADKVHGVDVEFKRVSVVRDETIGAWRQAPVGTVGEKEVTIPVHITRSVEPPLDAYPRTQLEKAIRDKGATLTEARQYADRRARWVNMTPAQKEALDPREARRLQDADEFFADDPRLYDSLMGLRSDILDSMERAYSLIEEAAAVKGERRGVRNLDTLLGRQGPPMDPAVVRQRVERAIDDMRAQWRLNPDMDLGATVNVRSGLRATRGVAIGTGVGEVRFALPEGRLSDDLFDSMLLEVQDWARLVPDANRPGAHIGIWVDRERGEVVLELAGVADSMANARRRGMDLDQDAVFNLATGETVNLPTPARKLRKRLKAIDDDVEGMDILDSVMGAVNGNHFDEAKARLILPENEAKLKKLMGTYEYERLRDAVETQAVIEMKMVPEKQAMLAARQARDLIGNPNKAAEAVFAVQQEAVALQRATINEEVQAVMETTARFTDLLRDIIGVGLDTERRFGDESLYPRVEGRVTLEASEMLEARVREARKLAADLGWDEPVEVLDEILTNPPAAWMGAPRKGPAVHTFSVFGVGGTEVKYKTTAGATAHMIEDAIGRWQTLSSPEGLEMFSKQLGAIARAWKSMATVARVNFHPRNLIGGVFNGMAADVGVRDYAWVRHRGNQYHRMVARGATEAEMAEFFGNDWRIFKAARDEGILGEGFARGDLGVEVPRGKGAVKLRDRLNPASGDFVPVRNFGQPTMRSIEDFLRLATFYRWHDELGAAGARDMVNMVHFNYTQLSEMDLKVKKFVPFWVWTKNNVGLQLRLLMERPDIVTKYGHAMRAIEDNFGGDEEQWPINQYRSPFAADLGIQMGDDERWARLLFDPDLPLTDLSIVDSPFSLDFWSNSLGNMLGPHVTMPLRFNEQNDWGSGNAPVGWNTVLRGLDMVGLYDARVSAQGDVQVGYGSRNLQRTLFPVISEYAGILGVRNDPEALLRQGITSEDGISLGERALGGLTFLGRGLGVQASTPNDARVYAYTADQRVREIVDELKLAGLLSPLDFTGDDAIRREVAAALEANR